MRIARFFTENWPIFTRIRAAHGRPELPFQVGVPGDFDTAMFALGLLGALRHRKAFTDATVREIEQIHAQTGDDVLFQLELCAELVFVTRTPSVLRDLVAARLARFVSGLIRRLPRDARFGVHLCLGDLGHRALDVMQDAGPVVQLANALSRAWPAGPRLEYVHGALAAGPHRCPGAALARMEIQVALTALIERFPGLRLAEAPDEVPWRTGYLLRSPERLLVAW